MSADATPLTPSPAPLGRIIPDPDPLDRIPWAATPVTSIKAPPPGPGAGAAPAPATPATNVPPIMFDPPDPPGPPDPARLAWLRRTRWRARVATVLAITVAMAQTALYWARFAIHPAFAPTGQQDPSATTAYTLLADTTFVLWLPCWIVTAAWLWRIHATTDAIAPGRHRHSRGWTWGSWIMPIAAFWYPKQVIDDAARIAHDPTGAAESNPLPRPWTTPWWLMWLAASTAAILRGGFAEPAAADPFPYADLLQAITLTVALALWIGVIIVLSRRTDRALLTLTNAP